MQPQADGSPPDDWHPVTDLEENFSLYSAVSNPGNNDPTSIPDIIAELSKKESLESGESICYIGSGNFAVVRLGDEEQSGFELKRIIKYEDKHTRAEWRASLRFKTDFPYQPNPSSLQSLYTAEDIRKMPRFN